MTLIIILFILVLLLAYVLEGRAWLKSKPWAQGFFALVEPIEIVLFRKSETLLTARLLSVGGLLVTAYDTIATFLPALDLTPITNRVLAGVPDDLRGMVVSGFAMGIGLLIAWLRKRTSKPLEIVELPDDLPADVQAVVTQAEHVKAEAIEVVKDARAEGAV